MAPVCETCGRSFETAGGLGRHRRMAGHGARARAAAPLEPSAEEETGPGYQTQHQIEEEVEMAQEEQNKTQTFETLSGLFGGEGRGIFAAPRSEAEQRQEQLDSMRRSIVRTMQVLIEVASLMHPDRLEAVLDEFKDETDFRRVVLLDWLDWVYRSYGQVHVLQDMMVRILRKQATEAGILAGEEELPEAPRTKLGPVLEELSTRIQSVRR